MPANDAINHFLTNCFPAPTLLQGQQRAAVALILRQQPPSSILTTPALDLLLIQRAPHPKDPWSAHIALPGGRRDASDPDDLSVAVRETHEEVGLNLCSNNFSFLARLCDRPIYRAGHASGVLSAFVFLQHAHSSVVIQPREVASAFWIPLNLLHRDSPLVCSQIEPLPSRSSLLISAAHLFGIKRLRMPACDVLPHAQDAVKADIDAPYVFLWGLTLDCIGDVMSALGCRRVDWPRAIPDNAFFATIVILLAELYFRFCFAWTWLKRNR